MTEAVSSIMVWKYYAFIQEFGMIHCEVDRFVFYSLSALSICMYLVAYVDIVIQVMMKKELSN